MLGFLIFGALALAFAGVVAIPFMLIGAVIWLVMLPFRIFFKLLGAIFGMVFGLGGALLGLIIAPIVMVIVAVALIGAFVSALLSLVVPLMPVALLALLVWAVYRLTRRPTPAF